MPKNGYPLHMQHRRVIHDPGQQGGFPNRGGGGWGGNSGFAYLPPFDLVHGDPPGIPSVSRAAQLQAANAPLVTPENMIIGGVTTSVVVGAGLGHLAMGAAGAMLGAGLGFLLPVYIIRHMVGFSK